MPIKTDAESALRYGRALHDIQDLLSGREWSADTLDGVAKIMNEAGFHLYDADDCDGNGPRWYTSSHGRIELQMSLEEAQSASHSGSCDDDVAALSRVPHIAAQLEAIGPDALRQELEGYGSWDETELADHDQNLQRILWIACGDICEEEHSQDRS